MVSGSKEERRPNPNPHSVVSERVSAVVESLDGVCMIVDTVVVGSCEIQRRKKMSRGSRAKESEARRPTRRTHRSERKFP